VNSTTDNTPLAVYRALESLHWAKVDAAMGWDGLAAEHLDNAVTALREHRGAVVDAIHLEINERRGELRA
jgi:histidine ammonia-lyase